MALIAGNDYFVSATDTVLRADADKRSDARNHLIFGDWLRFQGEEKNGWAKVRCRGDDGWLPTDDFSSERALEVNFVDIGQGDGCHIVTPDDQVILIDAGIADNMFRFVNWRYNLRGRKVAGVDGVEAGDPEADEPFEIDHVVISHPDKDHYYGFRDLFESPKLSFRNLYHNGIVERPIPAADKLPGLRYYSGGDLGGFADGPRGEKFLWDVEDSDGAVRDVVAKHPSTQKDYLPTLRRAIDNSPGLRFRALSADDGFLEGFGEGSKVELKLLGPLRETVEHSGQSRKCLVRLGGDNVTKNGHSVIFQLRIGRLKVMLGGDLNTESEDYLLRHYADATTDASKLEGRLYEIRRLGSSASAEELQEMAEIEAELKAIIVKGRRHFRADVTKACHHGSHHFSETFLQILDSIATVVSSGDDESYAHPRPDALGSFGKYGRGVRPLIFSTELARSTKEFSHIFDYFEQLKAFEARIAAAATAREKKAIEKEMQEAKDSNVARYGMITLRTDGEKVIIAQKLEIAGGDDNKWDIHELHFNEHVGGFEYLIGAKGH